VHIDETTAELRRVQAGLRAMREALLERRQELEAQNARLLLRYAALLLDATAHHRTSAGRRAARESVVEGLERLGLAVVVLDDRDRPIARNGLAERHRMLALASRTSGKGVYIALRGPTGAPEGEAIVAHAR
jgi:hypothetical protein